MRFCSEQLLSNSFWLESQEKDFQEQMMQKMSIIQTSVASLVPSPSLPWESLATLKSSLMRFVKIFHHVVISTITINLNTIFPGGKILKKCQCNCSWIPSLLFHLKKSTSVFKLIFFFDYCHMKGLDKQQNQEKLKSHQSGMVAANAEWTVIFGGIKINRTSFQL